MKTYEMETAAGVMQEYICNEIPAGHITSHTQICLDDNNLFWVMTTELQMACQNAKCLQSHIPTVFNTTARTLSYSPSPLHHP